MTLTNRRSQLAVVAGSPSANPLAIPPLPPTLPKAMAAEWETLVRMLDGQSLWSPEKAGILEAYLLNLHTMRVCKLQMDADGGPLAGGKPHPASTLIARHAQTAAKCAGLLNLHKLEMAASGSPAATDDASRKWKA